MARLFRTPRAVREPTRITAWRRAEAGKEARRAGAKGL